jgi:hypothetical protein
MRIKDSAKIFFLKDLINELIFAERIFKAVKVRLTGIMQG